MYVNIYGKQEEISETLEFAKGLKVLAITFCWEAYFVSVDKDIKTRNLKTHTI
jgi:hypothetical protein